MFTIFFVSKVTKISNKMELYQEPRPPPGGTYNKVIGGGGVRVLDLTPNPKV